MRSLRPVPPDEQAPDGAAARALVKAGKGRTAMDWQADVWSGLKGAGVGLIAYVPDAGHATAIRAARPSMSPTVG